jgi:hypothetical protein
LFLFDAFFSFIYYVLNDIYIVYSFPTTPLFWSYVCYKKSI